MKSFYTISIAVLAVAACFADLAFAQAPDGWILMGSTVSEYKVESDFSVVHGGHAAAMLQSKRVTVPGFGTLAQVIQAKPFRGKRVRLAGYIKTRGVNGWAGLWMRVDAENPTAEQLAFDNMKNRPILGTTEWKVYHVVLDVPSRAGEIWLGVLLEGGGTIWIDDITFEEVDASVPTTNMMSEKKPLPNAPRNLDFEH